MATNKLIKNIFHAALTEVAALTQVAALTTFTKQMFLVFYIN